ncbi:M24 family metallopeptidase [Methanothermococcus okinawensis]|uniref:Xaa-Pro dipeptidase n=1 Tax=Methanothermococcus okinawensis (strain DSM 14208 / JCM 11175 / IH1) TaxID=647113 RepID=F8ANV9_METOI|nr:M24 family metallopeptidase [Methanothermococcus okinawensis]AEH07100.1 Xaa-Pro dipeptidase [Methanothermococcus okinawensis IH1]
MKIKSFLNYLNENNIKKAVILKKENINYFLERYPPTFSILVFDVKHDRAVLKVPKLEYRGALTYKNKYLDIELFEKIEEVFKGCDGVEDSLPLKFLKYLDNYKIISDKIREMRRIKNSKEIGLIQKAAKISDKAIEHATELILNTDKPITECELAAEIEYIMKKEGSIKPSFDTIAVSDKKTALPHSMPSSNTIKNILLMDIGAVYEGYHSDITRTVILNQDKRYKDIYNLVNSAKTEAEAYLKEGVSVKELDSIARKSMGKYEKYFIHSLGHGVGVEIHEEPAVSSKVKEDIILKEGMVITIEPGIYLDDFGVRIEDLYLVKRNGFKKLSNAKIMEY